MNENPYDSPAQSEPTVVVRHSARQYAVASMFVVAFWLLATTLLFWLDIFTPVDGNISLETTSQASAATILGDPTISTHIFYVKTSTALGLLAGLVALSLVAVNGAIAFQQGKADA